MHAGLIIIQFNFSKRDVSSKLIISPKGNFWCSIKFVIISYKTQYSNILQVDSFQELL